MTILFWPSELVAPLVDGFQQAKQDGRLIARADRGPPRVRRGMSKTTQAVSLALYATNDERGRFDRFYEEESEQGALPFLVPSWGIDDHDLLTADGLSLLDHEDTPLLIAATWVCLFGQSPPTVAVMGAEWRISFDLVILP